MKKLSLKLVRSRIFKIFLYFLMLASLLAFQNCQPASFKSASPSTSTTNPPADDSGRNNDVGTTTNTNTGTTTNTNTGTTTNTNTGTTTNTNTGTTTNTNTGTTTNTNTGTTTNTNTGTTALVQCTNIQGYIDASYNADVKSYISRTCNSVTAAVVNGSVANDCAYWTATDHIITQVDDNLNPLGSVGTRDARGYKEHRCQGALPTPGCNDIRLPAAYQFFAPDVYNQSISYCNGIANVDTCKTAFFKSHIRLYAASEKRCIGSAPLPNCKNAKDYIETWANVYKAVWTLENSVDVNQSKVRDTAFKIISEESNRCIGSKIVSCSNVQAYVDADYNSDQKAGVSTACSTTQVSSAAGATDAQAAAARCAFNKAIEFMQATKASEQRCFGEIPQKI